MAKLPSGDNIYMVKGVDFIPVDKSVHTYTLLPKDVVDYVEGIKKLLAQGFYYSYTADLTSSQQRQAVVDF